MNEWYSDLPAEELTGNHVHVEFDGGGTLEGRLVFDEKSGYVRLDNRPLVVPVENGSEVEMPFPALLFETADGIWCPLRGIRFIELAWGEREWEQIPLILARDGDALVVNGERWEINGAVLDEKEETLLGWKVGGLDGFVYRSMASCALRRKGASDGV